jgi:hypothetical protein
MREQELRITSPAGAGTQVPRLELCGPWLEEAGFRAGARVEVEIVEPGRLVVTRVDAGGPVPALLPLVWVPVERLSSLEERAGAADV